VAIRGYRYNIYGSFTNSLTNLGFRTMRAVILARRATGAETQDRAARTPNPGSRETPP
jgi:hypothetical protein